MEILPCPDGYLLETSSPFADAHHALNDYLVSVEEQGWKIATKKLNALRDKHLKFRVWMAMLDRLEWLDATSPASPYFKQLHDLTYAVEEWTLALSASDLISALHKTAKMAATIMFYTPMPHLMAFVEQHGLTPELCAAIREFDTAVRQQPHKINQVRCQLLNSRLDMLAWWDEWNTIDLKRCWSEQVRADYRSMEGAGRENWRRLLHSIQGDETGRPVKSWLAKAEAQVQAIGQEQFRARLLQWFDPLRAGRPVKLSREGSFLLRSLIWLTPSLDSIELKAILAGIPSVVFKPKKNAEKVVRAASEAAGLDYAPPPPRPAPGIDEIKARTLAAVFSSGAWGPHAPAFLNRVRIDGETLHIQGRLDNYKVDISTGAIFRESDGAEMHVKAGNRLPPGLMGNDFGGVATLLGRLLTLIEDESRSGGEIE